MSRTIGKEISPGPLGQLRDRAHGDHLVHGGGQRDRRARHLRELRAPDAAGDHDGLGLDVAAGGAHPADPALLDVQADHLDGGHDGERAGRQRGLPHERARAQRVDHADRRAPERAEDLVLLQERDLLDDEVRADQLAPRCPTRLAEDIRRRSSSIRSSVRATSKPPDSVNTPSSLYWRIESMRQVGHLAGVVDREDEVRRVPGGAAGVGQRALVDLDDVAPAEPGEMVHEAVADDAGADHHDAGGGRNGSPSLFSPQSPSSRRRRVTYSESSSRTASSSGGGSYSSIFLCATSRARAAASFAPLRIHRS